MLPIGTLIAINRFPHRRDMPSHEVVGHRANNYLTIRPIGTADERCESYLPERDAIAFGEGG